uniref:YopX family protein n=1 Tax=uncultured Erythrobacter sp. TaxID=263913 RepID=UPI0026028EBF|nr:YopX family protein [uncultured Erythrobacter sp.]
MKREIKFRVWDKASNQMLDNDCLLHGDYGEWPRIVFALNGEDADYTLMQFTGLTDKNGTEIYEGDVVELHGQLFAAVYDAPQFWLSKDGSPDGLEDTFYSDSGMLYEVVGNVYENPELLRT